MTDEIWNMRGRQLIALNILNLVAITIFFLAFRLFNVTLPHFFLFIGIILFIQAICGFIKGDSTKSFLPIFEQVAKYEKEKMGREWMKQRKVGNVGQLLLSGLMFLQYYWNREMAESVIMELNFIFIATIFFLLFVLTNLMFVLHVRKVDRSTFQQELKGYTWKSNLIGAGIGASFVLIIVMMTVFYIFLY
ncbi:hypothetical protein [Oceanobacillus halophilus]|uniref:Uncharacterized protein n=1 Tax=Oceanobacillus halophilus TaxID=930130 RepID=A0A495A878_9BACI|nr:hypothetical protein [Oceanobacillus halophilus]RKQ34665.1 hypothetical protein D8M06_07010 [Oceanobacillus halophilus]